MKKNWANVRWLVLVLRIAEIAAIDLAASLATGLSWRDTHVHLVIAVFGVLRGFFSDWRHQLGDVKKLQ